MADYIPTTRDARFQWTDGFYNYFTANAVALGYTAGDVAELTGLWNPYAASYGGLAIKENDYRAAVTQLDGDEGELISFVRELVGGIQANGSVTDAQRASAGLPIRKTTRTATPVPVTRPVAEVDTAQRLRHTISFRNEGSANRSKPEGVRGCEIWCVIGPAPASVADARYLATDTASPYLSTFSPEDAGKLAHYFLRWVNTRNEAGPWSETVTATIGG